MPDNTTANSIPVATRSVTYSGDAGQNAQVVGLVFFTGSDDAKTANDLPGAALSDALANPTTMLLGSCTLLWDSVSSAWVRDTGTSEGTLLSAANRTATTAAVGPVNYGFWRGVIVWLHVTTAVGGQNLTPLIQGQDPVNGDWHNLNGAGTAWALTAGSSIGTELCLGADSPGSVAANRIGERISGSLPRNWRVQIVHSGAGTWNYTVTYTMIR